MRPSLLLVAAIGLSCCLSADRAWAQRNGYSGYSSPSAGAFRPSVNAFVPSVGAFRPSTDAFRPSTNAFRPSTNAFRPSTNAFRTTTTGRQPSSVSTYSRGSFGQPTMQSSRNTRVYGSSLLLRSRRSGF